LGCGFTDTNVPFIAQCAEIIIIALGFSMLSPILVSVCVKLLSNKAFIGCPCPIKISGVFLLLEKPMLIFSNSLSFMPDEINGVYTDPW